MSFNPNSSQLAWSHPPESNGIPRKLLSEHVHGIISNIQSSAPYPKLTTNHTVAEITPIIAYCHDIGKLTEWFQHHIGNPAATNTTPINNKSRNHSKIGAAATWYACKQLDLDPHVSLAATVSVLKHHGPFPTLNPSVRDRFIDNAHVWDNVLPEQTREITSTNEKCASWLIEHATNNTGSWEEFVTEIETGELQQHLQNSVLQQPNNDLIKVVNIHSDYCTLGMYGDIQRLWSLLTQADTFDAARITETPDIPHPDTTVNAVETHITGLPAATTHLEHELNREREQARVTACQTVQSLSSKDNVLSLSLQTGLGKTLTGVSSMIQYRDTTGKQGGIIYALPYTSIIEQTVETLTNVFNTTTHNDQITVDQHLTETKSPVETPQKETDARSEALAGNAWQTDITVTTFVQLFESLTGPSKRQGYKLPQLHNSIIILDEPQILPSDWWPVITSIIDVLTTQYNATVLSLTATQPAVTNQLNPTPLIPADEHPRIPDRVTYTLHDSITHTTPPEGLLIEDSGSILVNQLRESEDSILSVCNTISSVETQYTAVNTGLQTTNITRFNLNDELEAVYSENPGVIPSTDDEKNGIVSKLLERVQPTAPGDNTVVLIVLTSRHRPCDRDILLQALKELQDKNQQCILISTQLVEAGIDISFPRVYRDIAPLDNIVQVAGRCNRSYESGVTGGDMTVWQLLNENGDNPGDIVYGQDGVNMIDVMYETLERVCGIPENKSLHVSESSMNDAVGVYHELLGSRLPTSNTLSDAVEQIDGGTLGTASMIDSVGSNQFIVCRSKAEFEKVEELRQAIIAYEYDAVKSLLQDLAGCKVSLRVYNDDDQELIDSSLVELPGDFTIRVIDLHSSFHKPVFGVGVPESSVEGLFY